MRRNVHHHTLREKSLQFMPRHQGGFGVEFGLLDGFKV